MKSEKGPPCSDTCEPKVRSTSLETLSEDNTNHYNWMPEKTKVMNNNSSIEGTLEKNKTLT